MWIHHDCLRGVGHNCGAFAGLVQAHLLVRNCAWQSVDQIRYKARVFGFGRPLDRVPPQCHRLCGVLVCHLDCHRHCGGLGISLCHRHCGVPPLGIGGLAKYLSHIIEVHFLQNPHDFLHPWLVHARDQIIADFLSQGGTLSRRLWQSQHLASNVNATISIHDRAKNREPSATVKALHARPTLKAKPLHWHCSHEVGAHAQGVCL